MSEGIEAGGVVGRYLTKSGKIGAEIRVNYSPGTGVPHYRWSGEWGAGGGLPESHIWTETHWWLTHKRGVKVEIPFTPQLPKK